MRRSKVFDLGIGILVSMHVAVVPRQALGAESNSHAGPHDIYVAHSVFRIVHEWRAGKFDLSGYGYSREDKTAFERVSKGLSSAFHFEVKDNLIAIRYPGMAAVLEFRGDQIFLNGELFEVSIDRPLQSSLRNWALKHKKLQGGFRVRPSTFLFAVSGTIPTAEAQLDPVSYAVATTMAQGGDMAAFGMNLAMGQAMAGPSSAAVGGGAALTATGAAMVLGGVVVVTAAIVGVTQCELDLLTGSMTSEGSMRKRLNCYSEPLSWLGVNPRDRVYVQSLFCGKTDKQGYEKITVSMASSKGAAAKRELIFKGEEFVEFKDDANSHRYDSEYKLKPGYGKVDPLPPSEKKYFQSVEKEASRIRAICHDEKAHAQLQEATRRAHEKGDIGTSHSSSVPIRVTK